MKRKATNNGWERLQNLPPTLIAEVVGLRLYNNIDVAARRPAKQHESVTTVASVEPSTFTLADLIRVENAVLILGDRIQDSNIVLELCRCTEVVKVGRKGYRAITSLKIRASYGEDLPLADANLAPVRREYRRLMRERSKK